ncbi:MAG: proteasome assembly chaperone family protein [Candidatus Woesearchaeota archaeon]|nr:MAG: proteasome assembly chaperone family protein [Candidatus Woesearchaeota archaeon]
MEITLHKIPKNPIVIEGFPGHGLVSTIVTGYLVDHLNTEPIGKIWLPELKPIVAIQHSEIINPLEIFWDREHNIIIVQSLTGATGLEWKIAEGIANLCKRVKAKEIISIEGIASPTASKSPKTYYYASTINLKKKFEDIGIRKVGSGIVIGVTAALLLKLPKTIPASCIFVEAELGMPDSKAAAEIIKVLDDYLGLKVNYKPLLRKAEKFEENLKKLITDTKSAHKRQQIKDLNYLG